MAKDVLVNEFLLLFLLLILFLPRVVMGGS